MCAFFQLWSFENYTSKFRPHLRHKISCSFSYSPSTYLFLLSSSYPWLPMMVNLFLTHLLLEVVSLIIFLPSPFRCHWSSRSKRLHRWRRSKAYKINYPHSFIFYKSHIFSVRLITMVLLLFFWISLKGQRDQGVTMLRDVFKLIAQKGEISLE